MASIVDICNLALSHLGDDATVSSISPPEGSAQAEHCARFYPIARNTLLEMHQWNFASKRATLAQVANPWPEWEYAYALPADCLVALSVMPPDAQDDYATRVVPTDSPLWAHNYSPVVAAGRYVPQPYSLEMDAAGNEILLTNQENAHLRYSYIVTDTTKFSPLFIIALSHLLASYLAGPVLKGDTGIQISRQQMATAMGYLAQARTSDANQRKVNVEHIVPFIAGR
jgi:hypothetical protein